MTQVSAESALAIESAMDTAGDKAESAPVTESDGTARDRNKVVEKWSDIYDASKKLRCVITYLNEITSKGWAAVKTRVWYWEAR